MDDKVYTFIYRLLLNGAPVEALHASQWRMHVVTDKEERDSMMEHYKSMFSSEPNKTWEIIPIELPV